MDWWKHPVFSCVLSESSSFLKLSYSFLFQGNAWLRFGKLLSHSSASQADSCCEKRWPTRSIRSTTEVPFDAVLTQVAIPQEQPPVKTLTLLAEVGRLKFHEHS